MKHHGGPSPALSGALLALRITLGVFLLQWGVEKFVVPQNTVWIWGYFYGLNVSPALGYLFGAVEIAIAVCMFFGLFGTVAYGAALALHTVSVFVSWRQLLDPWGDPANHLFIASVPVLGLRCSCCGTGTEAFSIARAARPARRNDRGRPGIMFLMLQVASVFLVSIAMALSLAHALELPGKLRLGKDAYLAVQSIYYPGFTIGGGVGEGLGMVAVLALLLTTGRGQPAFLWTLIAFIALIAMHAVYWVMTHPVNKFWLKGQDVKGLGAGFFAVGQRGGGIPADADPDQIWKSLRDRWETSHVIRAALAAVALLALIVAVAI